MPIRKIIACLWCLFPVLVKAQTIGFSAPDTVCTGTPIQLQNTSTGVSTYFWNFCSGGIYNTPDLTSLGNPGGLLTDPVFTAYAKDGNNYYVFVTNNTSQSLIRLNFGNSLLNTPVATTISNIKIPLSAEGIQVVKDATGNWHVIVVGGTVAQGSHIVTIHFGLSLSNNPTNINSDDWGNIGNLAYPADLYVFEEGGRYYGFTCNFENSTITRFDFGTNFGSAPTAINLGSFGSSLSTPTGLFAIKENSNWYLMVTNQGNSSITRIEFGASLLNTSPTAQNLGNPDNALNQPRDISLVSECGQTTAIVVGSPSSGRISRLVFNGGVAGNNIIGADLGNPGGVLGFPHSISTVFREGNELYAFIPNVNTGRLTRMSFRSCTNASIPSSTAATPPAFQYNAPGIYTVNLITDEGLPTQQSFCRNIVVIDPPTVNIGPDVTVCQGRTVQFNAGTGFSSYTWSNGSTANSITANTAGVYSVTVSNGGCTATDDAEVFISQPMNVVSNSLQDIDCRHITGEAEIVVTGGTAPYTYSLDGATAVASATFTGLTAGSHTVTVRDNLGCIAPVTFTVARDNSRDLDITASTTNLDCWYIHNGAINVQVITGTPPLQFALGNGAYQPQPMFTGLDTGSYKVYASNNYCVDSATVRITSLPAIRVSPVLTNETCNNANGVAVLNASGGAGNFTYSWDGSTAAINTFTGLSAGTYHWIVTDANGCFTEHDTALINVQLRSVGIANNDTTINIGDEVILHAENGTDYHWEPEDGSLSCQDCATTIARPLKTTEYIVTVPPGTGCIESDTVLVTLTYVRSFFMPNAFTPNGDGQNDYFRPKAKGVVVYNLQIYNRWGELLFHSDSKDQGWDGTYKGAPQQAGVYVYIVNYGLYTDDGKTKMELKKGTFLLIR